LERGERERGGRRRRVVGIKEATALIASSILSFFFFFSLSLLLDSLGLLLLLELIPAVLREELVRLCEGGARGRKGGGGIGTGNWKR